jgi:hypothetical protein
MKKGLIISDIRHSTKVSIDQHHQCGDHRNEAKCSLEHSYKLKVAQNSWAKSTHRIGVDACFFTSFWVDVYFLFFENNVMLFCFNLFSFLHAKLLFLFMDFLNSLQNCFAHFFFWKSVSSHSFWRVVIFLRLREKLDVILFVD